MDEDITQLLKEEHEEIRSAVAKKKSKNLTKNIKVKPKKVKTTKQKEANKIKQTKKLKPKKSKTTKNISKNKKKKK
jgi:phage terminase small subunit